MYQVSATESALLYDQYVTELWCGLQQGMHDESSIVARVKQCRDYGDTNVCNVCDAIEVVARQCPMLPYKRTAHHPWDCNRVQPFV